MQTDALIVGGGPAGLAAAIALRQRGVGCVVVEARAPGIDKACGEGLMPEGLRSLALLGVQVTAADGVPFRGIRFENAAHRVDASFPDGLGIGLRRPRLHRMLAERAETLGADLRWETRVQLDEPGLARVGAAAVRYRWLIGADGQASTVRRWAGLDATRQEKLRFGFRRHYGVRPWSDRVEVHWARQGQLYITPVAEDCVCAVYVTRDPKADRVNFLAQFPKLEARLAGVAMVSQQRGGVSATRKLRRVATDRVALLGDASGSADSITGEGLGMSFRQAGALAEAIVGGSLKIYERRHREIGRLPHSMGRLMLMMDRWHTFERRGMHALASHPEMFQELLSVHEGSDSLARFALRRGARLGWNFMALPGARSAGVAG